MSDINKYRKGYEEMKEEIATPDTRSLAEQFVKGVASFPVRMVEDITRNDDEQRGRDDALAGRDFNPSSK